MAPVGAEETLSNLFGSVVQGVTFRSNLTSDYTFDPNAPAGAQSPPSGASWLMPLIQPAVYVQTPAGVVPIEPYGTPDKSYGTYAAIAAILLAVGAFVALGWVAKKIT